MTSSAKTQKWYPVIEEGKIPPREGLRVRYKDYEVALFNVGEEYLAVESHCPHKQGPLADGIVSGKNVFCPLHNWKIDLTTGCAVSGGEGCIKKYPVQVIEGKVCVAFKEGEISSE